MGESGSSGEQSESRGHSEDGHEDGKTAGDLEARVQDSDSQEDNRGNYRAENSRVAYSEKSEANSREARSGKDSGRTYSIKKASEKKPLAKIDAKAHHSEKTERTSHGTGLIIEYADPETGEVKEYLLEQRVYDNKDASQRGKYGLMGGGLERINGRLESDLENIIKEIREEVENPLAAEILIRKLEYVGMIEDKVDGKPAYTFIYRAKISSPHEWHIVADSRSADGAGPRYRIKASDFTDNSIKREDFMYTQGDFMFDYVSSQGINARKPQAHGNTGSTHSGHDAHSMHKVLNFSLKTASQYTLPVIKTIYSPSTLQKAA